MRALHPNLASWALGSGTIVLQKKKIIASNQQPREPNHPQKHPFPVCVFKLGNIKQR